MKRFLIYLSLTLIASLFPATAQTSEPSALSTGAPKVLLIGDSISGGYSKEVKRLLDGKVAVTGPIANAEATINGVAHLDDWIGTTQWDLIHFNWGLWDIYGWKYAKDDRSPAMYEQRLDALVTRLKKTGAKLIWATTTPTCREAETTMLKQFKTEVKITPEQENEYRDAALRVMKKHDIEVNDLHAVIKPHQEKVQGIDNVHFSGAGYNMLAKEVANRIAKSLNITLPESKPASEVKP